MESCQYSEVLGKSLRGPDIQCQSGGSTNRNEGRMTKKISLASAVLGTALLLAPIAVIGGVATSSAGATSATHVLTCTGKVTSKPSTYVLSCADAGAGWNTVTWSSWNATSAIGHGVLRQNNCTPNCVSGKFISYSTTVDLSHVVNTKKYGELFARAVFHYSVSGKAKTEVFDLAD